jgi:hypothetical protein
MYFSPIYLLYVHLIVTAQMIVGISTFELLQ